MLSKLRLRCIAATKLERRVSKLVWPASWLRDAEPAAAASLSMSLAQLMEEAGQAAFSVCMERYPQSKHWLILIGAGNNGGDGYVVARKAKTMGKKVTLWTMPLQRPLPVEAATAKEAWFRAGGEEGMEVHQDALPSIPTDVDVIIDGLLGTGIAGTPRPLYESVIRMANSAPVDKVAIDIPSGLNAETGHAAGACFEADCTVTFICLKPGLLTGSARKYVGQVYFNGLGLASWMSVPDRLQAASCSRLGKEHLGHLFSTPRSTLAHKGSNGRVALVGGDDGFGGAILMAAEAAVASGAGLTRVVTRAAHVNALLTRCPEVMVTTIPATDDPAGGPTSPAIKAVLEEAFGWADTIAVGPGLGRSLMGRDVLSAVFAHMSLHPAKTLVLDADALNLIAERVLGGAALPHIPRSIITPHPGEAARLLQCSVDEVEDDRLLAAAKLAALLGGTCVLKGAGTVVCRHTSKPDEKRGLLGLPSKAVIDAGNSGMATGGMGDVLTGMVAGVAAQQLHSPFEAACAAALAHSVAADLVAEEEHRGTRGVRPTEVIARIPFAVNPPLKPHTNMQRL